tara:strand:- start:137 stop:1648 length:1512 start_codon:yes stop_codon:yes gene_type:complete
MNEEEELQKPDPSQGIAAPDYSLDSLLYSIVAPKIPQSIGTVGGLLNQLRKKITNPSTVLQLQDEEQPLLSEQTFGTESNYLTRFFGEVTPQGAEYLKTLMMKGKFDDTDGISKKQEDKRLAGLGSPRRFEFTKTYKDEKYTNKLYNELINVWGMKDGTLDFDRYLAVRPTLPNSKRRILGGLFATPTGSKVSFSDAQDALIKSQGGLKDKYRNLIDSLGFPERQFQLHHVVPVLSSLPGYHGLRFASPEWWEVTEILFKNMMRPGDDQFNFVELVGGNKLTKLKRKGQKDRIFPTPHSVTHKFLDHYIGDDGQLFWTKDVRDKMAGTGKYSKFGPDMAFRKEKWQEYAELVQKSEDITNQAEMIFRDLYENIPKEQLDDELDALIERLAKLDSDGSLNLYRTGSGRYEVPQMKELVMDIRKEMEGNEAQAVLDSLTGREERQREFVRKRILEEIETRALDNMSVSDQMKEIQRITGMSIEDLQLLIQTNPKFDINKFIRDNQ